MSRIALLCLTSLLLATSHAAIIDEDPTGIMRGDVNDDGDIDVADVVTINEYLFAGGTLSCPNMADVNDDGGINISDSVYLSNYLYNGGEPPAKDSTYSCY